MNAVLIGFSHIEIIGVDALSWLQNLITADVESQPAGTALGAALLTPQGKILFDLMVLKDATDKLILEVRADISAALVQRLTLYKMRAKLTIGTPQIVSIAISNSTGTWRDLRFDVPVWQSICANEQGSRIEFDALRIEYGIAESGKDYMLNDVFPHDVNLDQIGGVGFRKGCYVGQEVVSRMQHRGTARRRMVVAIGAETLPSSGTPVLIGDREIGALGTVIGNKALTIIRLDKAAEVDTGISAGGIELTIALPACATFLLKPETETNA